MDKVSKSLGGPSRTPPREPPKYSTLLDLSNFSINAILRGMQLTLVGGLAHRALQNPAMFTSDHYKQAAYAVAIGIAIRLIMSIPIAIAKLTIWLLSLFVSLESVTWDDSLINGLDFMAEYVLQIPFFLMVLMRYMVPTLDNLYEFCLTSRSAQALTS
ncbi:transmembrane protein UsgS [Beauveria brongniartii RCEF 3172]|uniref:Transmembrane protein UsgS n=1 Tax=Beauveria brongniartii RCEF 3172 TaxID=1081107 RepID=A0A166WCL5_9HYPO|nr:transmembrane protein UsgS [Beauveria brongniartii RCEF 3172]